MSAKHIIQGYTNLIFKNKTVEEKYKIKKEICDSCRHGENGKTCLSSANFTSEITGQNVTSTGGCGCKLIALLRSDKRCPKGNF